MNYWRGSSWETPKNKTGVALAVACFLVISTYLLMIDLKGVWTDEGIRLGIMNGGQQFSLNEPSAKASWKMVLEAIAPYAYQPFYFLMQNTVMSIAQTHNEVLLRLVNIFFLWVSLLGLMSLSKGWRLVPRIFLFCVFSFNAYLIMHVLQIREYIVGVAFYVWSTWLVLRLDAKELGQKWVDLSWFAAYGVLLILGFYVQIWVVFPAIGQFLFLLVRRGGARLHFYAHLTLSYVFVLAATLPYLLSHRQKVDVGHWGKDATMLWPSLSDGFHLVLSGHRAGHSLFTDFLFLFWLTIIVSGSLPLLFKKLPEVAETYHAEFRRQSFLIVLSMVSTLVFQLVYFFAVDTLSVWPRYFVIYYFFLTYLLALAFKYLYDLSFSNEVLSWTRPSLKALVGVVLTVTVASGIYQTRSYYQNPYFDTGMSRECNWRTVAAAMSHIVMPGDVVLTQDFLHATTLTYTRPITNSVIPVQELKKSAIDSVSRFVYLEPRATKSLRNEIISRMTALGFKTMHEKGLPSADGKNICTAKWRVLIFKRVDKS